MLLVRFVVAVLVLLPAAAPAGFVAAELECRLRGTVEDSIQETHLYASLSDNSMFRGYHLTSVPVKFPVPQSAQTHPKW